MANRDSHIIQPATGPTPGPVSSEIGRGMRSCGFLTFLRLLYAVDLVAVGKC